MQNKIDVLLALFDIGFQEQAKLNEYDRGLAQFSQKSIDDARELLFKMIYAYQTRLTDED
tara:strand:- start:334 stop:513 length:180 start_codon:yes stop_codon:yes gene_type:complete